MADRQLIVAVEGTAAVGHFWQSIVADYLDRVIRCFCGNEVAGQKHSGANFELSLVVFNAHGPYSAFLVQRSGWTKDMDVFFHCLSSIPFIGGGFGEVAIAEGLAEALMDMVVFKPQLSSQQQLQHQQQQQQQQQQLQQQAQQQQQMVGAGMSQSFVQGPGRSQIMSQTQLSSQGPPSMSGNGFLS